MADQDNAAQAAQDAARQQAELQARQSAVHLANQRLGPAVGVDDLLAEAGKIYAFMLGGGQAAPAAEAKPKKS